MHCHPPRELQVKRYVLDPPHDLEGLQVLVGVAGVMQVKLQGAESAME